MNKGNWCKLVVNCVINGKIRMLIKHVKITFCRNITKTPTASHEQYVDTNTYPNRTPEKVNSINLNRVIIEINNQHRLFTQIGILK